MFNAPKIVVILAGILMALHAILTLAPQDVRFEVLLRFGFIPIRYGDVGGTTGGFLSVWLSPVSYAFLHGSWLHVLSNVFWMLAFGSAVAWRLGARRFLMLSTLSALGGIAVHYWIYPSSFVPVVGASAAISGQMAAASRFVFDPIGPLRLARHMGVQAFRFPAQPLRHLMRNKGALIFIGIWFAFNLVFGLTSEALVGSRIAWEGHIGGFLVGFALMSFIDPIQKQPKDDLTDTDRYEP